MTWMQTRDGAAIELLAPDFRGMSLDELAHSLARINRFCGHTRTISGYSVAVHSVEVSRHVAPVHALWGLMHDAHECALGDITSPVKAALRELGGGGALEELERRLAVAMRYRWDLHGPMPREVKAADLVALATERRDLLGDEAKPWNLRVDGEPVRAWDDIVRPMPTQEAKRLFISRYHEITGRWE
jgi:5'-deoxynucleotidase YfbR-like HD superfamily hydrolase